VTARLHTLPVPARRSAPAERPRMLAPEIKRIIEAMAREAVAAERADQESEP